MSDSRRTRRDPEGEPPPERESRRGRGALKSRKAKKVWVAFMVGSTVLLFVGFILFVTYGKEWLRPDLVEQEQQEPEEPVDPVQEKYHKAQEMREGIQREIEIAELKLRQDSVEDGPALRKKMEGIRDTLIEAQNILYEASQELAERSDGGTNESLRKAMQETGIQIKRCRTVIGRLPKE